jgi:tetraacyldisaccharide-1-P 4'-kinase
VGIAHNGDLLARLLDLGLRPRRVISLPDHGALPPLPPGCALTEKDAARLPPEADVWALILELRLGDGGEAALAAALAGCGLGAR